MGILAKPPLKNSWVRRWVHFYLVTSTLAPKKFVKWLFKPQKGGDLVILFKIGDGAVGVVTPLLECPPHKCNSPFCM